MGFSGYRLRMLLSILCCLEEWFIVGICFIVILGVWRWRFYVRIVFLVLFCLGREEEF